jgi:hypothetical protein
MNDIVNTTHTDTLGEIERVLVMGDLARLTPQQRTVYYNRVCESVGLNPLTRPFEYITLNGKLTLYARKDATDQLRSLRGITIRIAERTVVDDIMCVTAEATDRHGRTDSSLGAVSVGGLRGEARANALMKAETKAKRRVTLSICGLGFLDESELEGQHAEPVQAAQRAADRLLAAPAPAAAPEPPEKPKAKTKATTTEEPRTAPSNAEPMPLLAEVPTAAYEVIDIAEIAEAKTRSGFTVWKVTDPNGTNYAVEDPLVVDTLSIARRDGRPVSAEINRRGKTPIILSAEVVAE